MPEWTGTIRTEVYGLEICLGDAVMALTRDGEPVTTPILLSDVDMARLRLEMAKTQLWEWNRFEDLKLRTERRYKRHLGAWLVLCLAAFTAYIGYPSYFLPLVLTALSIFIWWRAGYVERQVERAAQKQRQEFVPDWTYLTHRLEEADRDSAAAG